MSEKQTCPKCDSHTSSVHRAWLDREPCPYCDDDLTRLPTPPCPTCGRPLAADSRPVVSEGAIERLNALADEWATPSEFRGAANDLARRDCAVELRSVLASLPHMGDGRGDGA